MFKFKYFSYFSLHMYSKYMLVGVFGSLFSDKENSDIV